MTDDAAIHLLALLADYAADHLEPEDRRPAALNVGDLIGDLWESLPPGRGRAEYDRACRGWGIVR